MSNLDELSKQMSSTTLADKGVSFLGQALKLDTADDAKPVVEAIANCKGMKFLNMEGNSLGVQAAKAIGEALSSKSEMTHALWKDMFTGRLKTEIPIALEFLGKGLIQSGAKLVELDISDNAMGPIGIDGLVELLTSPCCHTLQILKLNNLGLGITGAHKLAKALEKLRTNCIKAKTFLNLQVFIAGRNRLENEGACALAEVFSKLNSLKQISIPQNGIYHVGIGALCRAFVSNSSLEVINLNDNTITPRGALHLREVLPNLQNLQTLDLGDCLLKTKGALELTDCLSKLTKLKDVDLSSNELSIDAGIAIMNDLSFSRGATINLNGNKFGDGIETLRDIAIDFDLELKSFSDDEGDDLDDDEGSEEQDGEGSEEEQSTDEEYDDEDEEEVDYDDEYVEEVIVEDNSERRNMQASLEKFKNFGSNFSDLGPHHGEHIVDLLKERFYMSEYDRISDFIKTLVMVANLDPQEENPSLLMETCSIIGSEIISWATGDDLKTSFIINTVSAFLGCIKAEDKIPVTVDVNRTVSMLKTVPFCKSLWVTIDHCSRSLVK